MVSWLRTVEGALGRGEAVDISVTPQELPAWTASLELDLQTTTTDGDNTPGTRPRVNATTTRVTKPSKPRAKKPPTKKPATRKAPAPTKLKKRPIPASEPSVDSGQWQFPGDDQVQPAT